MIAVLAAVIAMLAAYLVVHGSTAHVQKHKHHRTAVRVVAAACGARSHTHAHGCSSTPVAVRRPKRRVAPSSMTVYAAGLRPVLDRTRALFDGVARAVSSAASLDTLGQVCAAYSPQVQVMADQVDGVPHPYPWYTPVGWFHHGLLGIYHRVQGALNLCGTAASNGDSEAAANAVSDILSGASDIRSTDDYAHWKSSH